ncbi:MAG: hydroxyethylthiazole kinase [Fibrobacter sp.]|nr:hydroxyethylthiazole kinase [Fibrobacter sp.]
MKLDITHAIKDVRDTHPLVHCITNYVTVNDVANSILAIGGSPIMADALEEVEAVVSKSKALVLNIGTLNENTVKAMILAGKTANAKNIPVILDPVGAGFTPYRTEAAKKILDEVRVGIIRGNLSEIASLAGIKSANKGVDASDSITDSQNLVADINPASIAKNLAQKYSTVIAITGQTDIISNGNSCYKIRNGHPLLSKVTGTGCMATGLIAAFAEASSAAITDLNTDAAGAAGATLISAAVAGIASMGIAGEIAFAKAGNDGTGSFHVAIIDALSRMNDVELQSHLKLEEV